MVLLLNVPKSESGKLERKWWSMLKARYFSHKTVFMPDKLNEHSHILPKWTVTNVVQVIFIMTSLSVLCQTHLSYITIILHWIPGKPEKFPSPFLVRAYQFQQLCVFAMMCILQCNTFYSYLTLCSENRQYIYIYIYTYTHTHTHTCNIYT